MKPILLIAILLMLFSCNNAGSGEDIAAKNAKRDSVIISDATKAESIQNKWQYSQDEDEMTSKTIYYVSIEANEKLDFDAPYDGGSIATLGIRYKDNENNVYLQVIPSQFNCNVVQGEDIRIRFDSAKPIICHAVESSDGSTNIIFLRSESMIISNLKKAKRTLIQAEFYRQGLRTMEFNTDGFTWPHPPENHATQQSKVSHINNVSKEPTMSHADSMKYGLIYDHNSQ